MDGVRAKLDLLVATRRAKMLVRVWESKEAEPGWRRAEGNERVWGNGGVGEGGSWLTEQCGRKESWSMHRRASW